jgi:hypothetical protein
MPYLPRSRYAMPCTAFDRTIIFYIQSWVWLNAERFNLQDASQVPVIRDKVNSYVDIIVKEIKNDLRAQVCPCLEHNLELER